MKNNFKLKYKIIAILSIFIFLFPNASMVAVESSRGTTDDGTGNGIEYGYSLDDDGTGGKSVKEIDWRFKAFSKKTLDTGISKKSLIKDETYGWYIYEANDEEWVVLRRMHTSKNSRKTRSK